MRNLKSYLSLLFMGALTLTSCQDDFDDPTLNTPTSSWLENAAEYDVMNIAQVKEKYWQDAENYFETIGESENGKHIMLKGRVVSSDASGNIYKNLVIQDGTGALTMSINQNSMCVKYRRGQELVLDLTGMTIGKYASLQQLGAPDVDETYGAQTTFMSYELFQQHSQMNGMPDLAAIDTITVNSKAELGTDPAGLRKWQSQLVRFNNVEFVDGGTATFAESKTTVNRTLNLADGNTMIVRTSGYSNFYADVLPMGRGDIVGILGYHTSGGWQLTLIDRDGCMNFGNPTIGPGAEENPYTVDEAISVLAGGGSATQVWTKGFIVGAVAPGVQTVAANEDIQFGAAAEMPNTLVIASDKECRDWTKCMVINLPQDSKLRQYGNLPDNPANVGKTIMLKGNLSNDVLGMNGITGNQGTSAEFRIEGVDVPDDPGTVDGDGTEEKPYTVQQVIALGSPGTAAWVTGYIVGSAADKTADSFTTATGASASNTNVFIAATPGETDYTKCVAVQLPAAMRDALSLQKNPGNLGKALTIHGLLQKYFGMAGVKEADQYKLDGAGGGDTPVNPPVGDGDGTKEKPYSVSQTVALNNPGTVAWVEGYIVGSAADKTADSFTTATGASASNTNVFIAATPGETDYTKCVAVQLPAAMRDALSLQKNPGNLGKKVKVQGSLEKYFGMTGVKNLTEYELDGQGGGDTPVNPPVGDGDGTKDKPYTVGQTVALNNPGTTAWVMGYIVGSATGKTADTFTTATGADASNTNFFIAATPTETDYTKCVAVQLPAAMRDALSLQKQPGNLGKMVKVQGALEKYFGMTGVKALTEYELDGQGGGGGDTPVNPPVVAGDGTKEKPYAPSAVIALNNPGTTAWVEGYIVGSAPGMSADTFTTATGADASNTNLFIADTAGETDYTKCVPVQLPAAMRDALSLQKVPGNLGKKLNINGQLVKYFGVPGVKTPTEYELK